MDVVKRLTEMKRYYDKGIKEFNKKYKCESLEEGLLGTSTFITCDDIKVFNGKFAIRVTISNTDPKAGMTSVSEYCLLDTLDFRKAKNVVIKTIFGDAPAETAQSEDTPTETVEVEDTPAEAEQVKDTPAEAEQVKDTPAEAEQVKDTPADTAQAEDTPAEAEQAEDTPADTAQAEDTPADTAQAEDTPADTVQVEDNPAETAQVEDNSAETAQAEDAPAETVQAEDAPAETVQVEDTPTETIQAADTPADAAQLEDAPAENTKSDNPSEPSVKNPLNEDFTENHKVEQDYENKQSESETLTENKDFEKEDTQQDTKESLQDSVDIPEYVPKTLDKIQEKEIDNLAYYFVQNKEKRNALLHKFFTRLDYNKPLRKEDALEIKELLAKETGRIIARYPEETVHLMFDRTYNILIPSENGIIKENLLLNIKDLKILAAATSLGIVECVLKDMMFDINEN